jgi:hypothetical protein
MSLAPICLFTYNRLNETKQTIQALQVNYLAQSSDLIIFSDAAKNDISKDDVNKVRAYISQVSGFKSVTIIERKQNFGLAKSIIEGVTRIINEYGKIIVMEDDLITSPNFLAYMNQGLSFYESTPKIWSVSGFSFPIKYPEDYVFDNTFGVRASSWGWATWKDRWDLVDWNVSDYEAFLKDKKACKAFNRGGSDMCKMLNDQMTGKINSWAIRFCYAQFIHGAYDAYPTKSKVKNVGFSGEATHTRGMDKRFITTLDNSNQVDFSFKLNIEIENNILKEFRKPYSILSRLKYKLLGLFK